MPGKNSKELGQSLIELIFAFFVMALVIIAIVGLATVSIRNAASARNNSLAKSYAEEGMEWLRKKRDTAPSWGNFRGHARPAGNPKGPKIYCLFTLTVENVNGNNWDDTNTNHVCYDPTASPLIDNPILDLSGKRTIFYREASLVRASDDVATTNIDESSEVVIAVLKVYWTDEKGTHETKLSSQFTNWQQ